MHSIEKSDRDDIAILQYKDFSPALQKMYNLGGQNRMRFEKASGIIQAISLNGVAHIRNFPITNHGETRIKSCVKIDLGGGYRIITQRRNKYVVFLFVGSHDDCESWLNKNKGIEIAHDKESGTLRSIFKSARESGVILAPDPKPSARPLLEKLRRPLLPELLEGVPPVIAIQLGQLSGTVLIDEIAKNCECIEDAERRDLVQDVICLLAADECERAELRLDEFAGRTRTIDHHDVSEILSVEDGDTIRRLIVGSDEYKTWLRRFSLEGDHLEWMLFMHPEQQRIVEEDFDGPAQLSGVSGSGKTCIAVRRALRLAGERSEESVLLVTLNRSLAGLISKLADAAAESAEIRSRIKVTSFFQLCQEMLGEFEPDRRLYYDKVSWKLEEHIDEVFREYYRCWVNSRKASVLLPIHQSLCAQNIGSEAYLREEFDWIRTALPFAERATYTNTNIVRRQGRTYPLKAEWREAILAGLDGWEEKMEAVGVIDYLGLTTALTRHEEKVGPRFTKVIVDESQDFGTTELSILRRLVPHGENDLFLCGDIAQHVLPKHRILTEAGIEIGRRKRQIRRNYRNTRQILEAAYEVLCQNLHEEMLDNAEGDLEILDPRYASRSSNKPLVLEAVSLEEEIEYARCVVESHLKLQPNAHCCITFAGYSACEVERFAKSLELRALDGLDEFLLEPLVLSDLEQTKGYEFDLVVIVNCCEGILPPHDGPDDEVYRDGCRLYVAMTRAKNDLYLSYHGQPSQWLTGSDEKLSFAKWSDVEELHLDNALAAPRKIPEMEDTGRGHPNLLTGEQYCYTGLALGLSHEAQQKLCELVDGRGMIRGRTRVKWKTIGDLGKDLESDPRTRAMFGPVTSKEIRENLSQLPVTNSTSGGFP